MFGQTKLGAHILKSVTYSNILYDTPRMASL